MKESPAEAFSERRRSARVRVRKPVVVRWSQDDAEQREPCFTFTISRFGCAVHCSRRPPPGSRLWVEYDDRVREGRIVYTLVNHSAGLIELAIGFAEDAEEFWEDVAF